MAVFVAEMRRGWKSLAIWSLSVGFVVAVCVALYPEMRNDLDSITSMFANMGAFTQAFGMDKLALGTLTGYYGIECGSVLGIGGGMFAAYLGIAALSHEEGEHTAEFLLAHPVCRLSVVVQKLAAVVVEVLVFNLLVFALSVGSIAAISEEVPWNEIILLHAGFALLTTQVALMCFGISAFLTHGGLGLGIGLALMLYFANLAYNITGSAAGLKYLTPFVYAEPSTVLGADGFEWSLVGLGALYAAVLVVAGTVWYCRKDIRA